jgi:hypothetical protein
MEFLAAETSAGLQSHRDQPEFGALFVTLDMDMGRLITVSSVEKESVRAKT